MVCYIVAKSEAGGRMDKFIKSRLHSAPDSFIYKMARKKNLILNGKKCEGREILKEGDEIKLFVSDETIALFSGIAETNTQSLQSYEEAYASLKGIRILKETEDLLFVDKPSGILSQKAKESDLSVNEWAVGYLLKEGKINRDTLNSFHPSVLNRLDRNTSGIVICSVTPLGSRVGSKLLRERSVHKYYECLVKGDCPLNGRLTGFWVKDNAANLATIKQNLNDFPENVRKLAKEVALSVKRIDGNKQTTRLEIELETGKSHQIRAMLSSFGYPLIGDYKYGNEKSRSGQCLHAARLEFPALVEELPYLNSLTITSKPEF